MAEFRAESFEQMPVPVHLENGYLLAHTLKECVTVPRINLNLPLPKYFCSQ